MRLAFCLPAVAALAGCARFGFELIEVLEPGDELPESLEVVPVYPTLALWNDYVRHADRGLGPFAQPAVPCNGSESGGPDGCLHAGLMRAVTAPRGCDGAALRDELDAFVWRCEAGAFRSAGMRPGRGLRHLLDGATWRANRVIASAGGVDIAASPQSIWWDNPVRELPSDGAVATLAEAGAVYVAASDIATAGVNVNADRVAVVVLPGATLSHAPGAPPSCNSLSGETSAADISCLVAAGGQHFLWIEGDLDAQGEAHRGIFWLDVTHSVVRGVRVTEAGANGFHAGVELDGSTANRLQNITVTHSTYGVHLTWQSNDNWIRGVRVGSSDSAVRMDDSVRNVVVDVVTANNSNIDWSIRSGGPANTFFGVTGVNNASPAVSSYGVDDNVYASVAAVNNYIGIEASAVTRGNVFAKIAVANNTTDLSISANGNRFTGELRAPTGASCYVVAGVTAPGLEHGTCAPRDGSDASLSLGLDASGSFVAKDVLGGDGGYRLPGADGAAFPADDNRGRCAPGACRTWDWRLLGEDTALRAARAGECGASGDAAVTDFRGDTFLLDAFELDGDPAGDDDGLCESGEACLHAPGFGAYQGEGEPLRPCSFTNGQVRDVSLFGAAVLGP